MTLKDYIFKADAYRNCLKPFESYVKKESDGKYVHLINKAELRKALLERGLVELVEDLLGVDSNSKK